MDVKGTLSPAEKYRSPRKVVGRLSWASSGVIKALCTYEDIFSRTLIGSPHLRRQRRKEVAGHFPPLHFGWLVLGKQRQESPKKRVSAAQHNVTINQYTRIIKNDIYSPVYRSNRLNTIKLNHYAASSTVFTLGARPEASRAVGASPPVLAYQQRLLPFSPIPMLKESAFEQFISPFALARNDGGVSVHSRLQRNRPYLDKPTVINKFNIARTLSLVSRREQLSVYASARKDQRRYFNSAVEPTKKIVLDQALSLGRNDVDRYRSPLSRTEKMGGNIILLNRIFKSTTNRLPDQAESHRLNDFNRYRSPLSRTEAIWMDTLPHQKMRPQSKANTETSAGGSAATSNNREGITHGVNGKSRSPHASIDGEIKLDSKQITQIANRVGRLLQKRDQFEGERRGIPKWR